MLRLYCTFPTHHRHGNALCWMTGTMKGEEADEDDTIDDRLTTLLCIGSKLEAEMCGVTLWRREARGGFHTPVFEIYNYLLIIYSVMCCYNVLTLLGWILMRLLFANSISNAGLRDTIPPLSRSRSTWNFTTFSPDHDARLAEAVWSNSISSDILHAWT